MGSCGDDERAAIPRTLEPGPASRDADRKGRPPRRAGSPAPKTLEGYDRASARLPPTPARGDVVTRALVRKPQNLVPYGPVGTGKARTLVAIGAAACPMGMRARHFTTTGLVTALSQARREGPPQRTTRSLDGTGPLPIDEFGYAPVGGGGARLLFQATDASCGRRGLAIAANVGFSRRGSALADGQMAAAIIDRVAHHGRPVVFGGGSHRPKHAPTRASWPQCEGGGSSPPRGWGTPSVIPGN